MKLRKLFATLSACAVAVSAMAISASAALLTKTGNETSAEIYTVDFTGIDANSVDKVVANITVDSGFCNGCIGYNLNGNWTAVNTETSATEGEWVAEGLAGGLGAEPHMEIQFWWVNPMYNEDGSEGDAGTASITSVVMYDASGNEIASFGDVPSGDTAVTTTTAAAEEEVTTTTTAAEGETTTTTTAAAGNTATGVEGVASVVALLTIAGAAVVITKKH